MPYDWAGTRILQKNTVLPDKRRVFNNVDTLVPTDLREWVTPGDREEIRRALNQMELPQNRAPRSFDQRALTVWRWVVDNIEYTEDAEEQQLLDFWQFPAETIAVKRGDCEDCAFLLASLLLGSGISNYCVRVVLGTVAEKTRSAMPHAWPIYKDESGRWCLLEATLPKGSIIDRLPSAESLARMFHESLGIRFQTAKIDRVEEKQPHFDGFCYLHPIVFEDGAKITAPSWHCADVRKQRCRALHDLHFLQGLIPYVGLSRFTVRMKRS